MRVRPPGGAITRSPDPASRGWMLRRPTTPMAISSIGSPASEPPSCPKGCRGGSRRGLISWFRFTCCPRASKNLSILEFLFMGELGDLSDVFIRHFPEHAQAADELGFVAVRDRYRGGARNPFRRPASGRVEDAEGEEGRTHLTGAVAHGLEISSPVVGDRRGVSQEDPVHFLDPGNASVHKQGGHRNKP